MREFTVDVGWTSSRPVVPDEHFSRVNVLAYSRTEAELIALQMVACRPQCQMPTSSTVTSWEERMEA